MRSPPNAPRMLLLPRLVARRGRVAYERGMAAATAHTADDSPTVDPRELARTERHNRFTDAVRYPSPCSAPGRSRPCLPRLYRNAVLPRRQAADPDESIAHHRNGKQQPGHRPHNKSDHRICELGSIPIVFRHPPPPMVDEWNDLDRLAHDQTEIENRLNKKIGLCGSRYAWPHRTSTPFQKATRSAISFAASFGSG